MQIRIKAGFLFSLLMSAVFAVILPCSPLSSQELQNAELQQYKSPESLTQEELRFVLNHKVLNIVSDPSWPPFEYKINDNQDSRYEGINISLIEKILGVYGLTTNFIKVSSYDETMFLIKEGKADIITGYSEILNDFPYVKLSDELYTIPLLLVSATGEFPPEGSEIFMSRLPADAMENIKTIFPEEKFTLNFCSSDIEVIEAFSQKKTDYMIIWQMELSYAENLPHYTIYSLQDTYSQRFGFSTKTEKEALSVFNKAASRFSNEDVNMIAYEVIMNRRFENALKSEKDRSKFFLIIQFLCISLFFTGIFAVLLMIILKNKLHVIEYDDVTPLHTYHRFRRDVEKLLQKARPNEYILLSLNIDSFSSINDSIGFENGNRLLSRIAEHFVKVCSRKEKYCRFYADNFVFFIKNPGIYALIEEKVFRLTDISSNIKEFLPAHYNLRFSSSVYYITDPSDQNITGMINKANLALKLYRNSYLTHRTIEYTDEMERENHWKMEVTVNMDSAMDREEFEVWYQPKFKFDSKCVVGAEALIRWNNPREGLLLPGKFVPLFEHNGFIEKIDIYVFKKVCEFLDRWNKSGKDGKCPFPLTISFNLSRFHLYDPDLLKKLTEIINLYTIEPSRIEVELTESIVFDNKKRLFTVMTELKNAGFSIAVDDFGSGYSSLNILKEMPADVIKLDKGFLSNASANPKETIIIKSVIDMAKKLNMETVAEGIETENQSELLRKIGCDIAQGFYFAKPMPEDEYYKFLTRYIQE